MMQESVIKPRAARRNAELIRQIYNGQATVNEAAPAFDGFHPAVGEFVLPLSHSRIENAPIHNPVNIDG